jgi:primosomal replication protein N
MRRRNVRSVFRRGLIAILLIASVLFVGTVGIHLIEGLSYVDSFYFMSMLATAQGPASIPVTVAGKLFASLMAFISVGTVIAALGFLFGPFFGAVWKVGFQMIEEEEARLKKEGGKAETKSDEPPEN